MAKKATGTALVQWEEKFAQFAKEATKGMSLPGAKFISFRNGRMSYNGEEIPGNKLNVVVLAAVREHAYYDPKHPFNPDDPQSPICYAFGQEEKDMVPHEQSTKPQCESCFTCKMNQFGSARLGEGKACKNQYRLAVIPEGCLEDLDDIEVAYMRIPVTSVRNWLKYANDMANKAKRPYWAVVTEVSLEVDKNTQFQVLFNNDSLITDSELFDPLEDLWGQNMESVKFPYAVIDQKEKKGGKKKQTGQRRSAGRR